MHGFNEKMSPKAVAFLDGNLNSIQFDRITEKTLSNVGKIHATEFDSFTVYLEFNVGGGWNPLIIYRLPFSQNNPPRHEKIIPG